MLHPLMLVGMVGLSIPIVLHLIQRQRLKPQVLATMQFLVPQDAANAFAPVPRDRLQLLLRLLLLAIFVLLMTRFHRAEETVGPRSLVVVFDQSLGMQRRFDEHQTLFDHQKAELLKLIDTLGPEDRMAVILVGDDIQNKPEFHRDWVALRQFVEEIQPTESGGRGLGIALRRAVGLLAGSRAVNACVLVYSHHSRASYQPLLDELKQGGEGNQALAFHASLEEGRVRMLFLDDRSPDAANLSIERAEFRPSSVHVGASSRYTAVVRNHGKEVLTTQVRLVEGENSGPPRSLTLEPGEAAHLDLVHRGESTVDVVVRAELEEDALAADNRFFLPLRIRDRRQVLLVTPAASRDEKSLEIGHQAVDLLQYALNPGEALGRGAGTQVTVKRVAPESLEKVSLPLYSLVVLHGINDLPAERVKDLLGFVKNGGGLWVIPEGDLAPQRFANAFAPLLGSLVVGPQKTAEPVQTLDRDESRLGHGLFRQLLREEWESLREVHVSHYHSLLSQGAARIALRAGNGDPLAVVLSVGKGQILVQLFGAGLEASSLPRATAFVPLVQEIATALDPRREPPRPDVLRVGETRRIDTPEYRGLPGEVEFNGPEKLRAALEKEEATLAEVRRAGAYHVTHKDKPTSRQRFLTVNHAAGASDLTPVDDEALEELFGTTNTRRLPAAKVDDEFTRNHEMATPMLVLLFLAFAIEALIGAWGSRRRTLHVKPEARA